MYMKKKTKISNFLSKRITKFSEICKDNMSQLVIKSLLYTSFRPLLSLNKKTKKMKELQKQSYYSLNKYSNSTMHVLYSFGRKEFTGDFRNWLSETDSYKSKNRIAIRIDGTKSGKKYGKKIPELEVLWDYVNRCKIRTHEIYIFVVSIGKKDYIVDFILVKKAHRKGWNYLAIEMIERFLNALGSQSENFIEFGRLSLDGAWGNGEMMEYIESKGFRYNAVKSGGKDIIKFFGLEMSLKNLEIYLSTFFNFKKFNPVHKLKGEYCSGTVELKEKNIPIKIVLRRFPKSKGGYRYLMILSTDLNVYDFQIAQCYCLRWGIEENIVECKQVIKITDYSYHSKEGPGNIEMFLALRFISYMFLNWYRVEHCRTSKTSIWKVADRFKEYFNDEGPKTVWKLFSG